MPAAPAEVAVTESSAKDAIIAWFRGEFAAANAVIDSLCAHLSRLSSAGEGELEYPSPATAGEYDAVFAAVHRRRMNWIPVLQMQKYYSIADVAVELGKVEERRREREEEKNKRNKMVLEGGADEKVLEGLGDVAEDDHSVRNVSDDAPESEITDSGSHEEVHPTSDENVDLCSNHEQCETRLAQMNMTKGFTAKEHVKGRMVNVVRGLKLYDDVFIDSELSKLNEYVTEIRVAGQKGELSGETYILYNQQIKGKKRELIQFGAPIFGHVKDETIEHEKSYIEPIPALLQGVIDHLVQWHLISESRKPNSCIINFFDEGEFSQPFLKPPHLEQPISTLLLSESTMAFGRTLVCDNDGNYKGPLMLSLKEGSVLVMRGNSSDMARHAMCPSPNKRVSITFFRVRQETNQTTNSTQPLTTAMTLWQPSIASSYAIPNGNLNGGEIIDLSPRWGLVRTPLIMLAPAQPIIMSPRKIPQEGTGVFLPWTVGQRKPARRLPPRAQKRQMLSLSSTYEMDVEEHTTNPEISLEVKSV